MPRALAWGPSVALFMSTLLVKVGLSGPRCQQEGMQGEKRQGTWGREAKPLEKQVDHETVQFDEFIFGRREITG